MRHPRREALCELIARHCQHEGVNNSAIAPLHLFRASHPGHVSFGFYEPSICIIASGSKSAVLGEDAYRYDAYSYLLVALELPISTYIEQATPEDPHLALHIDLSPDLLAPLISSNESGQLPKVSNDFMLSITPLEDELHDAVVRLVSLLDTPEHIPALAPLILQEINYRLLCGPERDRLIELALSRGQLQRVALAIELLRQNYAESLRMEELAKELNISVSTLHHQFKALTSLTPLQFQKQLRLQAAYRLMLAGEADAASAAFQVGYESPSQFSREYYRMFGEAPARHIAQVRAKFGLNR
jgi:AraC-like DNA-binding protein